MAKRYKPSQLKKIKAFLKENPGTLKSEAEQLNACGFVTSTGLEWNHDRLSKFKHHHVRRRAARRPESIEHRDPRELLWPRSYDSNQIQLELPNRNVGFLERNISDPLLGTGPRIYIWVFRASIVGLLTTLAASIISVIR